MNWDYVAGFWDGEGSIAIYIGNYKQRIIMIHASQKDRRPLEAISEFLHLYGIDNRIVIADKKRDLSRLIITKVGAAQMFLEQIQDILIVKREIAQKTLRYIKESKWRGHLTEQDKQQAISLYSDGNSLRKVAEFMNRNRLTIARYLGSLGLTKRGGKYTWNLQKSRSI